MDTLGPVILLAIVCLIDGIVIVTVVTWFVSHWAYMRKHAALHRANHLKNS